MYLKLRIHRTLKACQVLAKESTSKALNLELQIWEPNVKIGCVKNRGTEKYTLKSLPGSPPLQGGRGLANHPLICHHQRGVWQPRKGEKMREKGKTGELEP